MTVLLGLKLRTLLQEANKECRSGEVVELQAAIKEYDTLVKKVSELKGELISYANCIDALVDNGSITHDSNVELDAMTDGMRAIANK